MHTPGAGMPMSAPPTYVPAAMPQMAPMDMGAPMPAAPIAPVPVKRPLTISAPPEGGPGQASSQQLAAAGQQADGAPRGGGGRRYSARAGGLSALD